MDQHCQYHEQTAARMGKFESSECPYGDAEHNNANHTFFFWRRWENERSGLKNAIGQLSPDIIVQKMVSDGQTWNSVSAYVVGVLKTEKLEEK
ncbi:hypothetical protein J6590_048903 [Homalodisca vitripennis]|nr:hypothetical protein J6590_037966 [Homalodisca vitripennis]KAG8296829.1 hypothetical protein J6590_048903 [Homalodisca vitripennis]